MVTMSNPPSPLKYMGTQSHETMAMEAALAARAARSAEQAADTVADGTLETRARQGPPSRVILIAAGLGAFLSGLAVTRRL